MKKFGQLGFTFLILTLVLIISNNVFGRARYDIEPGQIQAQKITQTSSAPYVSIAVHRVGKLGLTVVNMGQIGTGFAGGGMDPRDPNVVAPSAIYPYPGDNTYLFAGAFWVGAIVGRDTLVSVGADGWQQTQEMYPDPYPKGEIIYRTLSNPNHLDAKSEEDFIMMYTDTVVNPIYVAQDERDGRPHMPLNIEVNQRSYAWSYSYAEDFVLFDMSIKNIGNKVLNKFYMGMYVDGDVGSINGTNDEFTDDICGFKRSIPSPSGCGWIDTINIAWISDNNGRDDADLEDKCPFGNSSYNAVTGMRVVRTPSDSLKYSFNWWISNGAASYDFGPRLLGDADDPYRDFGGFLGTPEGDRNKYYIMSHEEFDYDQLFCAKNNTADGWRLVPENVNATDFANGFDTRYLLSFGPFNISPGEVLPLTFAYVAGENFFSDCDAYEDFNPKIPEDYYSTLDFSGIGLNAIWAEKIFDNPGVDTDGSGFFGYYRICVESTLVNDEYVINEDTVYHRGDGIPDFKGASPPPSPELWVIEDYPLGDTVRSLITPHVTETNSGEVKIQWYGYNSETTKDPFSSKIDFEGYRVYLSLSEELHGFTVVSSFDLEDYNRYKYDPYAQAIEDPWILTELPFSIDSLKILYGEGFNPNSYPRDQPFYFENNSYYFAPQDWNQSVLTDTTLIHKMYPDQPPPSTLNYREADPDELMDDYDYFKYYMYEFTFTNLLPSQQYFFSVTAFDFGSPTSDLASLETQPNRNFIAEYPQNQTDLVESGGLNVVAYPNPYRIDANYKDIGFFEGRGLENPPDERIRRIHFTNLPHKCTIRIFSLDGDLVREIEHNKTKGFPGSMHDEWDLITRNTQMVVPGIYYYSVESEYGNQIGKLVIIL